MVKLRNSLLLHCIDKWGSYAYRSTGLSFSLVSVAVIEPTARYAATQLLSLFLMVILSQEQQNGLPLFISMCTIPQTLSGARD